MPHIHEKVDFTVDIYLVRKNKVLLRKHEKYHKWLAVGGHIELDEDPNQAAVREVKEEVGMDIQLYNALLLPPHFAGNEQELIPPYFMDIHPINSMHKHISLVYFAYAPTFDVKPLVKREAAETCWFSREDIESADYIMPRIKKYALRALNELATSKASSF